MSLDTPESYSLVAEKPKPFTKGVSGNPAGKPPGPNKSTRLLKEAIMAAAEIAGDRIHAADLERVRIATEKGETAELVDAVGLTRYLVHLAEAEPRSFSTLMGKVLPMQVQGDFKVEQRDGLTLLMEAVNGRTRTKS